MLWYTVYNAKDEVIAIGPAHACAKVLGYTLASFHTVLSRVRQGNHSRLTVVVEDIETGKMKTYGQRGRSQRSGIHPR